MSIIISTDKLIPTSEARKKMAQLLDDIQSDEKNYFVIMQNGKVAAVLVHPNWLKEKLGEEFPSLEKIRSAEWERYTQTIGEALKNLKKIGKKNLPTLLRS